MTMSPEEKLIELKADHKKVNADVQAVIKDIKETKITDDYTKKDVQEVVDKLNTYLFMYNTAYSSKLISLTREIEDSARKRAICADPTMMARINKAVVMLYEHKKGYCSAFIQACLTAQVRTEFSDVKGDDYRIIWSIIEELLKNKESSGGLNRLQLQEMFIAIATYSNGTVLESDTAYATYNEAKRKLADMADVGDGPIEFVKGRVAKIFTSKEKEEN